MSKSILPGLCLVGIILMTSGCGDNAPKPTAAAEGPGLSPDKSTKNDKKNPFDLEQAQKKDVVAPDIKTVTTDSGLKYQDIREGTGAEATTGKNVYVHYTGWLVNGKKFDSSRDHGDPFNFTLGRKAVIAGWDEGIVGMKVGGKRRLIIPAALAYGSRGHPPTIPPNAELTFEVELLQVK